MDTQIWVAIISGVFLAFITPFTDRVIIPLFTKKRPDGTPTDPKPSPTKTLFLTVVGGLIGVLLGYFFIGRWAASPCQFATPTWVSITAPVPGSKVTQLITVEGEACNLADDEELWLFVIPEGVTSYYPQMGPVLISDARTWATSAYIGINDPVDSGRGFILVTALADKQGGAAIRAYFTQAGPEYKGLDPLPQGIRLMNQVKVTRK